MTALRKVLTRLGGRGPAKIAAFADIAHDRTNCTAGVHRAEDFTGTLVTVPVASTFFSMSAGLRGESPQFEVLPDGPRYQAAGLAPGADKRLMALTDAGVITTDGIVYCRRTRRAVAETVRQWTAPAGAHPVFRAPNYPAPVAMLGRCLNLGTLSGEGFYHFLIEALPRLHLARPWLSRIDHVLANGTPGSFHEQWLVHAGVPCEKIVWLQGLPHFACEQVLFADYPMRDQQPSRWSVDAVRSNFPLPARSRRRRKLWISRSDALTRQIAWEEKILAALPGFERVLLSRLDPAEQIQLFTDAEAIIAPHGAGLANVVFCEPGTKVVELFPLQAEQPMYSRLAAQRDLVHSWSHADFGAPQPPSSLAALILDFVHD